MSRRESCRLKKRYDGIAWHRLVSLHDYAVNVHKGRSKEKPKNAEHNKIHGEQGEARKKISAPLSPRALPIGKVRMDLH